MIEELLEKVYPNRWDYDGDCAVIHFPQVTIRNSRGESHIMKDIFIKFNFTDRLNSYCRMLRTTYSFNELASGYCHSHIRSFTAFHPDKEFRTFCFGGSTLRTISDRLMYNFSEQLFHFFLIEIKKFLEWESIVGVPYMRIEDIRNRYPCTHVYINYELIRKAKYYVDVTIQNSMYRVVLNSKELAKELPDEYCAYYIDGTYVTATNNYEGLNEQLQNLDGYYIFKDKEYYYKVDNTETNIGNHNRTLNPIVETQLLRFFNQKTYLQYAKNTFSK